jgi:hypothetical protein
MPGRPDGIEVLLEDVPNERIWTVVNRIAEASRNSVNRDGLPGLEAIECSG